MGTPAKSIGDTRTHSIEPLYEAQECSLGNAIAHALRRSETVRGR